MPRSPQDRVPVGGAPVQVPVREATADRFARLVPKLLASVGIALAAFFSFAILQDAFYGRSPSILESLWAALVGSTWLAAPFLGLGRLFREHWFPKGPTYALTSRIRLLEVAYRVVTLGARRALRFQLSVQADGFQGRSLAITIRFQSPSGAYLEAVLPRYRGRFGEAIARHRTPPLRFGKADFPDLWLLVPTRALPLPPHSAIATLYAEILLSVDGEVHLQHRQVVTFPILPADRPLLRVASDEAAPGLPGEPLRTAEVRLLEPADTDAIPTCGVCGDPLEQPVTECPVCRIGAHADCWEFLGGCSVYGCPGGPGSTD